MPPICEAIVGDPVTLAPDNVWPTAIVPDARAVTSSTVETDVMLAELAVVAPLVVYVPAPPVVPETWAAIVVPEGTPVPAMVSPTEI